MFVFLFILYLIFLFDWIYLIALALPLIEYTETKERAQIWDGVVRRSCFCKSIQIRIRHQVRSVDWMISKMPRI